MSDQPFQNQEYWLGHRAPANDGYSMALGRALEAFGPDLLDAADLYGTSDAETMSQLQAAVADPETTVRVYRAVPWEHTEINPGDWRCRWTGPSCGWPRSNGDMRLSKPPGTTPPRPVLSWVADQSQRRRDTRALRVG